MANTPQKTARIIVTAALLAFGVHVATAAWVSAPANPPSGNLDAPINATSRLQVVRGPLWPNSGGSSNSVGLNVGQGLRITSALPNVTRLYINETADQSSHWSGVEMRKSGAFQGGLFKLGGADTDNDIAIWNRTKPAITVKQSDLVDFAGPIKISGGTPTANKVLTAVDSTGLATWSNPVNNSGSSNTNPTYTLGAVTQYSNKRMVDGNKYATQRDIPLCPSGVGQVYWDSRGYYYKYGYGYPQLEATCNWKYASNRFDYTQVQLADYTCPAGSVLVGFNYYNAGDHFGTTGSLYCKPFIGQ